MMIRKKPSKLRRLARTVGFAEQIHSLVMVMGGGSPDENVGDAYGLLYIAVAEFRRKVSEELRIHSIEISRGEDI